LKVLHISLYDRYGGACIAAYRQHEALRRHGVDSKMWVRFKVTNDPDVLAYKPPTQINKRFPRVIKRHLIAYSRKRAKLRGEMFSAVSEYGIDILSEMPEADIINVNFAWEFLDFLPIFSALPKTKPIVVTMHEMATFTGGCSYTGACQNFTNSCGNCPQLGNSHRQDYSFKQWENKFRAYSQRDFDKLSFVAVSNWLALKARESSILQNFPITVIHSGLNTEILKPYNKEQAKSLLGIPVDEKVVSFAAASLDDERKGTRYLVEAINGMRDKPYLLTWSRSLPISLQCDRHLHLKNIESEHLLAIAYSASDVFVMPSLEEAFGLTALESLACGTPVAAFAAGGICDMVRHEKTGLLAQVANSDELRAAIERLLNDSSLWESCRANAVAVTESEFSYTRNAEKYIKLYSCLLK
jgi:glycosyltransferase involved in cell wall biosynthesis